ncbi:MAG: DUF4924 family protein [Flavobacteriales bacterium]|nr:DUF4924 family protein [Flavobacteriales bacterium]
MIIAREKRKSNIVEYILYMWNVEDILRSVKLNMAEVERLIVSQYDVDEKVKTEIKQWYSNIVDEMKDNRLQEKGHIEDIVELISELNMLHQSLLHLYIDNQYTALFDKAENNIKALSEKSKVKNITPIEAGLNGLYGIMLLRMKKKNISTETNESIKTISDLMALLSIRYREMKSGNLHLNFERKN